MGHIRDRLGHIPDRDRREWVNSVNADIEEPQGPVTIFRVAHSSRRKEAAEKRPGATPEHDV